AEFRPGLARLRPALSDIPGAAWLDHVGQGAAGDFLEGGNHLAYRMPLAGAQVPDRYPAHLLQAIQRFEVAFDQVHHMYVIANAGADRKSVVRTVDAKLLAPPDSHLKHVGQQIVRHTVG